MSGPEPPLWAAVQAFLALEDSGTTTVLRSALEARQAEDVKNALASLLLEPATQERVITSFKPGEWSEYLDTLPTILPIRHKYR